MTENPVTHVAPHASHFQGHRERLRTRFREASAEAVSDYELLELQLITAQAAGLESESCDWRCSILPLASG
jgi:hypothetical protein